MLVTEAGSEGNPCGHRHLETRIPGSAWHHFQGICICICICICIVTRLFPIILIQTFTNSVLQDEEIDVVGDDGSESSFASHRKKLSAFTIESILSGMADIKDEDSLSETGGNLNTSFEEGMERDFARSPSPTTSTASSPPTSPHMSAVMAHHIRQYQVIEKKTCYKLLSQIS